MSKAKSTAPAADPVKPTADAPEVSEEIVVPEIVGRLIKAFDAVVSADVAHGKASEVDAAAWSGASKHAERQATARTVQDAATTFNKAHGSLVNLVTDLNALTELVVFLRTFA